MEVISVVRKYIIKDLTGLIENYYIQVCSNLGTWEKWEEIDYGIDIMFHNSCWGGHMEIVKYLIKKGVKDWNHGLHNACEGGHMKIVKLMIKKGANDWNEGMLWACWGGHIEIVKLMISKGANNWNKGLFGACEGGQLECVKYMIGKGADKWDLASDLASIQNYTEIVEYIRFIQEAFRFAPRTCYTC